MWTVTLSGLGLHWTGQIPYKHTMYGCTSQLSLFFGSSSQTSLMDTIFSSSFAISLLLAIFIPTLLYVTSFAVSFLFSYMKELVGKVHGPPIAGTLLHQVLHFNTLFDYLTSLARRYPTYRLIAPFHDRIYTCDPANVEYILKTNFSNYSKVAKFNFNLCFQVCFCLLVGWF